MELNSLCCYFHSNLCCIQFSHSCFYRVCLLSSLSHCCTVNHHLSSFYLCCHISKLELCVLELTDCAAKLLSLFYVSDCSVKSALCKTKSLSSDTDTSTVKCMHSDLEALTLLT